MSPTFCLCKDYGVATKVTAVTTCSTVAYFLPLKVLEDAFRLISHALCMFNVLAGDESSVLTRCEFPGLPGVF